MRDMPPAPAYGMYPGPAQPGMYMPPPGPQMSMSGPAMSMAMSGPPMSMGQPGPMPMYSQAGPGPMTSNGMTMGMGPEQTMSLPQQAHTGSDGQQPSMTMTPSSMAAGSMPSNMAMPPQGPPQMY